MRRRDFLPLNHPPDQARPPAQLSAENGIRQQPADNTRTRTYTAQQLRDAIAWRDIFKPQVNLRSESDPDS